MESLPYVELQEIKTYYPVLHSDWTVSKQLIDDEGTVLEREFDELEFSTQGIILHFREVPREYPDRANGHFIVKTLFSVKTYKSAKWQEEPNDLDTNEPIESKYNDFNAWTIIKNNWLRESTFIDILKESLLWEPEFITLNAGDDYEQSFYTGNWLLNGINTGRANEIYVSTGPYYVARCFSNDSVYLADSTTPAPTNTPLLLYAPRLKVVKPADSLEPITINLYGEHWSTIFEYINTESIDTVFHAPTTINKLQPPNKSFNDNFPSPKQAQLNKNVLPRSSTTGLMN
jgi:hypothetical protein